MPFAELCLTVDIDWAHDEVIADTLALVAEAEVAATWFVTHATPVLADIRRTSRQELGLHPNFNPMLDGAAGRARDTFLRIRDVVPDAVSVRSHSLTRSSRLATLFYEQGMTHESNYFLPPVTGAQIKPWRDVSGLFQVPIRWEDDVRLLDPAIGEPNAHLGKFQPFTVDFHPIHVYLNTVTIADYENARPFTHDPAKLLTLRRPAGCGGSRDRLLDLLALGDKLGSTTCCLSAMHPENEA
nr:hypothetical protein [Methylobacterium sp. ZNC0032]